MLCPWRPIWLHLSHCPRPYLSQMHVQSHHFGRLYVIHRRPMRDIFRSRGGLFLGHFPPGCRVWVEFCRNWPHVAAAGSDRVVTRRFLFGNRQEVDAAADVEAEFVFDRNTKLWSQIFQIFLKSGKCFRIVCCAQTTKEEDSTKRSQSLDNILSGDFWGKSKTYSLKIMKVLSPFPPGCWRLGWVGFKHIFLRIFY